MSFSRPAVFLDRDGVLNEDTGYISNVDALHLFHYVKECIQEIHNIGYLVIVISNQSGIARGIIKEDTVLTINKHIIDIIGVDKVYYCPHYVGGIVSKYSRECECRKPKTGLIKRACNEFDIDMSKSLMVGDRLCDIQMGINAGIRTFLVKSKYSDEWDKAAGLADYTVEDLRNVVDVLKFGLM